MELRKLKLKGKNKRGDITDSPTFMVLLFVLCIGFFIITYVVAEVATGLKVAGMNSSVEGASAIDELESFGTTTIQRGVFFLFIGMVIGTMVSAFFLRTHPIFIFLYVFFLIVMVYIGTYIGNAYETFANTPLFAEQLAEQVLISFIMNNYLSIIVATTILSWIFIFVKFGGGGGQVPL